MEPEVHIIEKYFQEILHCFTMTNIKCKGGKEIDLLAINPRTAEKYHVEARVSTTRSFSLRLEEPDTSKGRSHKVGLDYFEKQKFRHPIVVEKVKELFGGLTYQKVLVVWGVHSDWVFDKAEMLLGIQIWLLGDIVEEMMKEVWLGRSHRGSRDDIMRIVEFMGLKQKEELDELRRQMGRRGIEAKRDSETRKQKTEFR